MNDPFNALDLQGVQRHAIEAALEDLRRGQAFHTRNLIEHREVVRGHRMTHHSADFSTLLDAYLTRHALALGVRGPLPGTPALGSRWTFLDGDARPDERRR